MKEKKQRSWTPKELVYLRQNMNLRTTDEIAQELARSVDSVRSQIRWIRDYVIPAEERVRRGLE